MAYSIWLSSFGWGIFSIALIASIVLFAVKRKFYPVFYLLSIATYVFTIGFVIDAFDLGKNSILLVLAFSAIVFIAIGAYFGNKFKKHKQEFENQIPLKK